MWRRLFQIEVFPDNAERRLYQLCAWKLFKLDVQRKIFFFFKTSFYCFYKKFNVVDKTDFWNQMSLQILKSNDMFHKQWREVLRS